MLQAHLPRLGDSRIGVAVYNGEGAGWRSVRSTVSSLERILPKTFKVGVLFVVCAAPPRRATRR